MDYLTRLKDAMINQNIDESQIETCIIYSKRLLDNGFPVIFDKKHLSIILKLEQINSYYYNYFTISTNGKMRLIAAPSRKLKERQKWILKNILEKIHISDNTHGFVKDRSIVSNATKHVDKMFVLNMDIKDFFPSIKQSDIKNIFIKIGYVDQVAEMLAYICCKKESLPQGAPTSPYLSNIICVEMDNDLEKLAVSVHSTYTRYADDITFSSNNDLTDCILRIDDILNKYGFQSNKEKTHMFCGEKRKLVTGLIVNSEVKIPKAFKRHLKQQIYYCKKFGVAAHLENSKAQKFVNFREHLYGKAYYVKMVEPTVGQKFLDDLDKINWN